MAIELMTTVIVADRLFCDRKIVEPCGVLVLASEGAFELRDRINAAVLDKCPGMAHAPIVWRETCPTLLAPGATEQLIKKIKKSADGMRARFNLPLGIVIIDTVAQAAGYPKAGDENDPAVCQKLFNVLHNAAKACECFILAVDHFGKTIEAGTRGGSSKEGSADVVLALLGDKETSGKVVNTRLALRKVRGGPSGQEFSFQAREVQLLESDADGEFGTTCVIDWGTAAPSSAGDPWETSRQAETKLAMRSLRRAIMKLLATHGVEQELEPGNVVRVINIELVREEFFANVTAEGTPEQKWDKKRKRFHRTVDRAEGQNLIGRREIEGVTYLWFVSPERKEEST
jgi:hypothetical protein